MSPLSYPSYLELRHAPERKDIIHHIQVNTIKYQVSYSRKQLDDGDRYISSLELFTMKSLSPVGQINFK